MNLVNDASLCEILMAVHVTPAPSVVSDDLSQLPS